MPDWHAIADHLNLQHGIVASLAVPPRSVAGGDINAAWCLETDSGVAFLKTSDAKALTMFSAETDGLKELACANAIRVPDVFAYGATATDAYIAIEWLEFSAASPAQEEALGHQLATLHRVSSERYGWHRNNTIGLTPQTNIYCDNWVQFFREQRLDYQLGLAAEHGHGGVLQDRGRRLADNLERIFDGYEPDASLLHGDLWGGNWAVVEREPAVFDPAVYYGDRETDLAMTRLFGGFGQRFYDAYEESWPLEDGATQRCELYQLYHVLNHLNLFGRSYLGRSLQLIESLLGRFE